MKRRILPLALIALFTAPGLFACVDCFDGWTCTFLQEWGRRLCYHTETGCVVSGWCSPGATENTPPLASEYRVAAVRVIPADATELPAPAEAAAVVASAEAHPEVSAQH